MQIPKIKSAEALDNFKLRVAFDDGDVVIYDVMDDINQIKAFKELQTQCGLFKSFEIDESRTCINWTDQIDLPSDTLKEFGVPV